MFFKKRPFVELDGGRFAAVIPDWCSRAFKTYFKEMSITACLLVGEPDVHGYIDTSGAQPEAWTV